VELRNPLSKWQLDKLRPRPLVVDFTHTDFPGPLLLGTIPAGYIVRETVVWIKSAFDGGAGITVGDMAAQARLQELADNNPDVENHYNVNNVHEYAADTDVYVFFPAGTPTTGEARAVVYLD
jgi:hypothetical protein